MTRDAIIDLQVIGDLLSVEMAARDLMREIEAWRTFPEPRDQTEAIKAYNRLKEALEP